MAEGKIHLALNQNTDSNPATPPPPYGVSYFPSAIRSPTLGDNIKNGTVAALG